MPPPPHTAPLRNRYVVMRHGRSVANEAGVIVSDPALGVLPDQGLAAGAGKLVEAAVLDASAANLLDAFCVVYSSPFRRARQTAELARQALGAAPVRVTDALRERFFGDLDGGPVDAYEQVWARDAADPTHRAWGVEPVADVLERALGLIRELEASTQDATVLLVAHGDTLQILQTAFEGMAPGRHRALPPLATAGIRELRPTPLTSPG